MAPSMGGVYLATVQTAPARLFFLALLQRLPRSLAGGAADVVFRDVSRARFARPAHPAGLGGRSGCLTPFGLQPRIFIPCASLGAASSRSEVAHRTVCGIEPLALLTQLLATGALPDVFGFDAAASLATRVVVVDLGVDRMPRRTLTSVNHALHPPSFGRFHLLDKGKD